MYFYHINVKEAPQSLFVQTALLKTCSLEPRDLLSESGSFASTATELSLSLKQSFVTINSHSSVHKLQASYNKHEIHLK